MKKVLGALAALAVVLPLCSMAAETQPRVERHVLLQNGEQIGELGATIAGDRVEIRYAIDDNGRGPKLRESLVLGADGLPARWQIAGTAWVGAPVRETFEKRGGTARWRSNNDAGRAPAAAGTAYLANDASPWILGAYVRAALARPDRTLPVLPGGKLAVEKVRDVAVGAGRYAIYALNGLGGGPTFVMLDDAQRFAGLLQPGTLLLPEGAAADAAEFQRIATTIDADYLQQVSKRLARRDDPPVHVVNARIFDPRTGTVGSPRTVTVYDGRITAVRDDPRGTDGGVVVDAEGGTLVPGLFDAHTHLSSWLGLLNLAGGVTTVRDMANDNAVLMELKRNVEAGTVLGPRFVRSGFLEGRSPFSARGGFVVADLPNALDSVRWYADRGYAGIKIYNSMNPKFVGPIAAEAHRLGLRVYGHIPAFYDVESAIRDGYDEVTHVNQFLLSFLIDTAREDTRTPFRFTALGERAGRLDLSDARVQRVIGLMQQRGVAIDPTLVAFDSMLRGRPGVATATDAPWLDHAPVPMQRGRRTPALDVKPAQYEAYGASWRKLLETVKLLHDRGIRILPGTDDGAGSLVLVSELQHYADAGIPRAKVLKLATLSAAEHFGLADELGTVERGKLADFFLVPGDPTQDLQVLRRARVVVKGGTVLFPAEIHAALAFEPFAAPPPIRE